MPRLAGRVAKDLTTMLRRAVDEAIVGWFMAVVCWKIYSLSRLPAALAAYVLEGGSAMVCGALQRADPAFTPEGFTAGCQGFLEGGGVLVRLLGSWF